MNLMLHEKRLVASLIDMVIVAILTLVFSIIVFPFSTSILLNFERLIFFSYVIFMFLYQVILYLIFKNKTIGQQILKVRVYSETWTFMSFRQIILRSITFSLPVLVLVNLFMVFVNKDGLSLYDKVSNSIVVDAHINMQVNKKNLFN